ncbi:unnamed protein product [Schistosoma haematobium]|nr:unnamed protein product [Schistosoma haematobium]CAH8529240.1 unnamed protein product [Schistosoma haematobium]
MDVRIKYPFKHFLKEGIVSKPKKKRTEVNNHSPTNTYDTTGPKDDENALMISSGDQSQTKYRKQPRIIKGLVKHIYLIDLKHKPEELINF